VSSGETTLDLYRTLNKSDQECHISMCDPWSKVFIRHGIITSVRNEFGHFVLHYVGPLVFSPNLRWIWAISKFTGVGLDRLLNRREWGEKHSLLTSEIECHLRKGTFSWISWDVFQGPAETHYDVIRIMNLFNERLFTRGQVERAIANVHRSLNERGILLIGQTDHLGVTSAAFYRKKDAGFREVKRVNGTTKFSDLINSFICKN